MTISAIFLLVCILAVFTAMARQKFGPEIGMPLLALAALGLTGLTDAERALRSGFEHFAYIAVVFTSVAMAAHLLRDSNALKSLGMVAGQAVGVAAVRLSLPLRIGVPAICLTLTWMLAATLHNTTSILITAEVAYLVCTLFDLPPGPVLNGCLIASNLGGFSTRWGDTPNLVEAKTWGLVHADFLKILCVNLGCETLLIFGVAALLASPKMSKAEIHVVVQNFARSREETSVNWHLALGALVGLLVVIVPPIYYPELEIRFLAAGMLWLCLVSWRTSPRNAAGVGTVNQDGRRNVADEQRRENPFAALGFNTLCTLCAVFVLAEVLGGEHMGIAATLKSWLQTTGAPVWAVATVSYLGTLFTEAASWANAASGMVHSLDPSQRSAMALGAGICAGSSSLITAASAGVLLLHQTARYPRGQVTFASYLWFGLSASLLMLVYYSVVLSLVFRR